MEGRCLHGGTVVAAVTWDGRRRCAECDRDIGWRSRLPGWCLEVKYSGWLRGIKHIYSVFRQGQAIAPGSGLTACQESVSCFTITLVAIGGTARSLRLLRGRTLNAGACGTQPACTSVLRTVPRRLPNQSAHGHQKRTLLYVTHQRCAAGLGAWAAEPADVPTV